MESQKDWIKRHADTMVIIIAVVGAAMWMNNSIKDIQKDVAIMKTVLILKGIMPPSLATNDK
jgi:hypothetical protein